MAFMVSTGRATSSPVPGTGHPRSAPAPRRSRRPPPASPRRVAGPARSPPHSPPGTEQRERHRHPPRPGSPAAPRSPSPTRSRLVPTWTCDRPVRGCRSSGSTRGRTPSSPASVRSHGGDGRLAARPTTGPGRDGHRAGWRRHRRRAPCRPLRRPARGRRPRGPPARTGSAPAAASSRDVPHPCERRPCPHRAPGRRSATPRGRRPPRHQGERRRAAPPGGRSSCPAPSAGPRHGPAPHVSRPRGPAGTRRAHRLAGSATERDVDPLRGAADTYTSTMFGSPSNVDVPDVRRASRAFVTTSPARRIRNSSTANSRGVSSICVAAAPARRATPGRARRSPAVQHRRPLARPRGGGAPAAGRAAPRTRTAW